MRQLMLFFIALAVSTPALAKPGPAMPQLDVTGTCRAATGLNLSYGQSLAACMRDEAEARKQVAQNWTSYSAAARSRCSAETVIGGSPSYVELFVCLDMHKNLAHDYAHAAGK